MNKIKRALGVRLKPEVIGSKLKDKGPKAGFICSIGLISSIGSVN
jgi:hypothetical protein